MKDHPGIEDPIDDLLNRQETTPIPAEVEARAQRHLAALRERMESRPDPTIRPHWPRMLAYAVPALTLLVIGVVLWSIIAGNSAGKAYAIAVHRLQSARTLSMTIITNMGKQMQLGAGMGIMPSNMQMKMFVKEPGRMRMEMGFGLMTITSIVDGRAQKGMILIPSMKKCTE